jgi:hypothetical protein
MADPVGPVGLTLDTLFGDASPMGILNFSSWIYASDLWGSMITYVLWAMAFASLGRMGYLAIADNQNASKRIGDEIPRMWYWLLAIIIAIAPLMSASTMEWVGIKSTQPIPTLQAIALGTTNASWAGADSLAQKLASLNPVTAPSMPLLRKQADGYFTDAETAVKMAKANVEATGGAMSGADLNANLLHGAGVAYASAGMNNANTPPQKLLKMLLTDRDTAQRIQYLWRYSPNAAMTECVGNTMLSDMAMSLNESQFSTAPNDRALTAPAWDAYYQAAKTYLVGSGNSGGSTAQHFGSAWKSADTGEAGSDIQLPPASDILKNAGPREIVINAEAYRGAFFPGADPAELQQSGASASARLAGTVDAQQRANLQRLLAAVNARDAAQAADLRLRNQSTAAFETLYSAFAMANTQSAEASTDFSAVLKNARGEGAATLNDLVQKRDLVNRCQAYSTQIKAAGVVDWGSDIKNFGKHVWDQINDPTAAAKLVGTGGWLKLGAYYLETASSYKSAYDNVNDLREAAKSETGSYFAGDPVAIQATNAGNVALGLGAGMMAGGAALQVAGSVVGNTIAGPGKAVGGMGEAVGKTLFDWGKFLVLASIFRDFAPYIVFVIVVFWWFLRLTALVIVAPAVVLITGLRNAFALNFAFDDMADMAKRIVIIAAMPIVYVIAWEIIFVGSMLIDVLIAATNGKTGVLATAGNLITGSVEQAAMSSNIVPIIVKFVLGLIIATVPFKIEGWLDSFMSGHGTKDSDMTAPSARDLAK